MRAKTSKLTDSTDADQCRWRPVADLSELHNVALGEILACAATAIRKRGQFHLVLAGGDTPRAIYKQLRATQTDWSAWHIYFGDERCLPPADPRRNSVMAGEAWLDYVEIPPDQLYTIPGELGADLAACEYAQTLNTVGTFDLTLLGLGEDGHTASLFPDHPWGTAADAADALAVLDAPRPPPQRVSLSAARLGRAHEVVFLVAGASKRDAVMRWRASADIPARAVSPATGVDVLLQATLLYPHDPQPPVPSYRIP